MGTDFRNYMGRHLRFSLRALLLLTLLSALGTIILLQQRHLHELRTKLDRTRAELVKTNSMLRNTSKLLDNSRQSSSQEILSSRRKAIDAGMMLDRIEQRSIRQPLR